MRKWVTRRPETFRRLYCRIAIPALAATMILSGCMTTGPSGTEAGKSGSLKTAVREKSPQEKIYGWLVRQQNETTGLLGNQEGEGFCGTYAIAVAAICFTHQGDTERAERIFHFYQTHYDECFGSAPGGFYQFWDAHTGDGHKDSDRWIGDNAWLLIALNHYKRTTGSSKFDDLAAGIAKWLISLQDSNGGIWSGYNKNGRMDSKSTEGNLDCYAALADYPEARAKVRQFLTGQMWLPTERRFKMGTTCPDPAMDTSAWGVSALGVEFAGTLDYAEETFLRTLTAKATGKRLTAFSDLKDKNRIWLEGSGEMVVAYNAAGRFNQARRYLTEMENAMLPSAEFPGTAGLPCHTNDPAWESGADKIFVPSQAWYLFGAWGLNPMAVPGEGGS